MLELQRDGGGDDRDDLDVTQDTVLVLQNAGPRRTGDAGMGNAAAAEETRPPGRTGHGAPVRRADERHELWRLNPARRAGTFVGGPLALVRTGDIIELDVAARTIRLRVPDDELARRRAEWKQPESIYPRGYGVMFSEHIGQADLGCDFDFLRQPGHIPEPEIH